jgi:hypothetical protein
MEFPLNRPKGMMTPAGAPPWQETGFRTISPTPAGDSQRE